MSKSPVTEDELHAYVDERLPPSRRAEVEAWLAARPQEAARIDAYRRQNETLRALFAPALDEAVPERLQLRPAGLGQQRVQGRGAAWLRMAAMLAAVWLGGGMGWVLRGEVQLAQAVQPMPASPSVHFSTVAASDLARRAAVAHAVYSPDIRRPVEIGADQEEQLVAWLSKRLGMNLKPPALGSLGYELIGGRLLPGTDGPVAQFMYHDASGKRLTLYVSHELKGEKTTAFQFAEEGPIGVFFWVDQGMGYAISAGADKGELARVAQLVYEQINQSGLRSGQQKGERHDVEQKVFLDGIGRDFYEHASDRAGRAV